MVDLKEITKNDFLQELVLYKLVFGETCEGETFYKATVSVGKDIFNIGLIGVKTGILPQINVSNSNLFIGIGEMFYCYDLQTCSLKKFSVYPAFYEMMIEQDILLAFYELGVLCISSITFDKIWEVSFCDIIEDYKIESGFIVISLDDGSDVRIDIKNGNTL